MAKRFVVGFFIGACVGSAFPVVVFAAGLSSWEGVNVALIVALSIEVLVIAIIGGVVGAYAWR